MKLLAKTKFFNLVRSIFITVLISSFGPLTDAHQTFADTLVNVSQFIPQKVIALEKGDKKVDLDTADQNKEAPKKDEVKRPELVNLVTKNEGSPTDDSQNQIRSSTSIQSSSGKTDSLPSIDVNQVNGTKVDEDLLVRGVSGEGSPSEPATNPTGGKKDSVISYFDAVVLGVVEGVTEFLPVSSTGHLVIASELLGVRNGNLTTEQEDAVAAFEIIIQSGAIIAVIFLYWKKIQLILLGLIGRSKEGRQLLLAVIAAFLPTAILGLLFNKLIKTYLQHSGPVIVALALGGLLMILFERSKISHRVRQSGLSLTHLGLKTALLIGLFQSIAMWPGTSRSMMTILGGMLLGLNPVASAEFSFLLGLPTLLAATALKAYQDGEVLVRHVDWSVMAVGLVFAALSAFVAVKAFVSWLNRHGLAPFGWYRIIVAAVLIYLFHFR